MLPPVLDACTSSIGRLGRGCDPVSLPFSGALRYVIQSLRLHATYIIIDKIPIIDMVQCARQIRGGKILKSLSIR